MGGSASNNTHSSRLARSGVFLYAYAGQQALVRYDRNLLLVSDTVHIDSPIYRRLVSYAYDYNATVVLVRDVENPKAKINLQVQMERVRRLLYRSRSDLVLLSRQVEEAAQELQRLRAYCGHYGIPLPPLNEWLPPGPQALLELRSVLASTRPDPMVEPAPPPVMFEHQYPEWAYGRLKRAAVSTAVRLEAERHIRRRLLIFVRNHPPLELREIRLFKRMSDAFRPVMSLTAWIADLAKRHGAKNVPELYSGLLEVLSSPFVPAATNSVDAALKRDKYCDERDSLRIVPYLELDCPCCSAKHEYRPANRLSVRELMNVPIRTCCSYAPDIWLPLANYTEAEIKEIVLEYAVQNVV
jgi:hypothetical protein